MTENEKKQETKDNKFIHVRLNEENSAEIKSISEEVGKNINAELVNQIIKSIKRERKLKMAQSMTKEDRYAKALKDPEIRKQIDAILNAKK